MDHDDTDLRSQKFQLAGEDNSKFSSGLWPFALPKLDIDDQLQNHLIFDNLVDSEVFFSVQGHNSSWIEALSTGSSIVDFSSSAAESCSLSKTNNVWSEATSTESVEMLLKSVGESVAGNMDDNALNQLSGMDRQIDPSNENPKFINLPTYITVMPTEKDQSQSERSHSSHSRMTDDPSSTKPQLDHFVPFSMDEKSIVSEKLTSSHKTSENCPAAGHYFEAVQDDHFLDRPAELESRKSNSKPLPEFGPIQNIYITDSYHFEHANQESEVGVPQDSDLCHIKENKAKVGQHDVQNLSHIGQPFSAVGLPTQVSNETLLPGSSDGLLEAITNQVKMQQRNDDTFKAVSHTQPSFSPFQQTEGLRCSVDMDNEVVGKEFGMGSNSAPSHQSEPNLSPDHITSISIESRKINLSPERKLDHGSGIPEERDSSGADSTNIFIGDHEGYVDNLVVELEEKKNREDISAVSGNIEQIAEIDHEENATGATTSNDKFDSSNNTVTGTFHVSEKPDIPLVNQEGSFKEGDTPALEQGPENTHLILTGPGPQEKISAPLIISSSRIISTMVTDTYSGSKDKNDSSADAFPDDSSALLCNLKDAIMSTVNHDESFKGDAKSALEDEDHNVTSPGSKPQGEIPAISTNPEIDAVCSGAASVAKEDNKHAIPFCELTTGATQDKSGNHPDAHSEKCQTGGSLIQSECQIDLATPSTLGTSNEKAVEKETTLNAGDDIDAHGQGTVLNCGTDHSPASVMSQSKLDSSADRICADATCAPPSVISCAEPSPQKGEVGSSILPHQTLVEQPENVADSKASGDTTQKLEQWSNRNVESTIVSEEANTAGDDRSFSFEVEAQPDVSEKAHSPAWNPFPRFSASQSTEATKENPQSKSSGRPLNNSSDSKKTSVAEAGKEQQPQRKITESYAGPSDKSKIGDSSRETSPHHSTPECSDLVNLPFTDSQHVQLRAQIFVYGALIQGTPPGEAYMLAAFGEPGSGKPTWEAAWRAALKRFQCEKSIYIGLETPTSSHLGSASEKTTKGTAVKTAPASKKGGKTMFRAHSAVALHSPTVDPSSSKFNLQQGTHLDFSQAVSPLFTNNSCMRHPSSGPGPPPCMVQPGNLIFNSSRQPAVPANEISKGPSTKNISVSNSISAVVFPSSPAPPVVSPLGVVHEQTQKAPTYASKGTSSQKPRKRKKASSSPEQQPIIASPQLTTDMVSFTPAAKQTSSFTLSTTSPSNSLGSRLVSNIGQITSVPNYPITGSMNAEQRKIFPELIRGAVEQSAGHAKSASLHSIEAARHKESIWGNLSTISKNKIPREVEEKLTSAAAAAEAAVSVAKAAAEAAKMASEAALQVKMMAEEALNSSTSLNSLQNLEPEFNVNTNLPSMLSSSPASAWKIKGNSHALGSVFSVAREVARKRVEEASAAAKRAENLDAILKAAEVAAEAVFNAGTIIGMGEPLPFTLGDLLEAGPDGFWKFEQVRNIKAGNGNVNLLTETSQLDVHLDSNKPGKKHDRKPKLDQSLLNSEPSSSARESQPDGQSGHGVNDVPAAALVDDRSNDTAPTNIIWNGIEKGSAVEVSSYVSGFGVAWFSAKVVDMNEDSALISYDNRNEGSLPPEEWVPLKLGVDKVPQIRLVHPHLATLSKFKTRKRRRETTGKCSWVIGDHVDAWFNDRWREGIIAQNLEAGEAKFVVQFSDAGVTDSLVVDAWNLRPSLVWKDGQWIEWSQVRERKSKSNKGDSPLEKRQRVDLLQAGNDKPCGEPGGPSNDKSTNNLNKPEELRPLSLSQRDMIFNVGKSVVDNKTEALAFKRPGLQKEGSKVVYGVPRHGKKKKFMEVSKHYVAGQSDKITDNKISSRVAKHMVPSLPRPRDNTLTTDQSARRVGDTRFRGLPKPSKSQTAPVNTILKKDSLPMPAPNTSAFERNFTSVGSTSTSNTEKSTVEKNKAVVGPVAEDLSVSEVQASSTVPTSKKNVPTNRTKRKVVPSVDNRSIHTTSERNTDSAEPQRASSDSTEPRRSNRRIQPTSRLLEGLQSSLIVSKVPGEKGPRSQFRNTTSRGRAHG